jgi:hypothetical protein
MAGVIGLFIVYAVGRERRTMGYGQKVMILIAIAFGIAKVIYGRFRRKINDSNDKAIEDGMSGEWRFKAVTAIIGGPEEIARAIVDTEKRLRWDRGATQVTRI